ncbi:RNA 3'-terminal phosphate cyclase [Candidatus Anstonella stagnisolia]|nr:RNA 3'-terminal phosphate cyclase [Candidatus Anstonella stagnisolia]
MSMDKAGNGKIVEIDGSAGEGGGQVLRTSLSLSCMQGIPARICNIRAGRSNAGLARQHLAVVNALGKISNAKVKGAQLGSTCVEFEPGGIRGGEYEFDIGSAGAITLLAQAILPVLCNAKEGSRIVLKGGTHVKGAPFWDYFENVFLGCAAKFGVEAGGKLKRAGFYPKGGGEIELFVKPCKIRGADFLEQKGGKTKCRIYSCGLPAHVAQREKGAIENALAGNAAIETEIIECKAACAGNAIAIWEGGLGACGLGEVGKKAENVAQEAAMYFLGEKRSKAAVDSHCADQLLLYMAGANGKCSIRTPAVSNHLKTNMRVIEKFKAAKFSVKEEGGNFIVTSEVM